MVFWVVTGVGSPAPFWLQTIYWGQCALMWLQAWPLVWEGYCWRRTSWGRPLF